MIRYPASATDKVWQSKKTKADRLLKKTGLGTKLIEAEKRWNAVPWVEFAEHDFQSMQEVRVIDQKLKKVRAAYTLLLKVQPAVQAAAKHASNLWKLNGLSPEAKQAARDIWITLTDAQQELKRATDRAQSTHNQLERQRVNLSVIHNLSLKLAGNVVATASKADWRAGEGELAVVSSDLKWTIDKQAIQALKKNQTSLAAVGTRQGGNKKLKLNVVLALLGAPVIFKAK